MKIQIKEKEALKVLLSIFFMLFIMNAIVYMIKFFYGYDSLLGLTRFFNFYEESNLPTWFSSFLLTTSSFILLVISFQKESYRDKNAWFSLAIIFLFLSIDETAKVHELIGSILSKMKVQQLLPNENSSSWVLYGAVASTLVALYYFRFWLRQQADIRILFLIAAIMFIGGALGFEVIEIYYLSIFGTNTTFYVLTTIEESLEMLGIIIFIYALLKKTNSTPEINQD